MKNYTNHGLKVLCSYLIKEGVGLGINIPMLLRTYAELEGLDDELLKDRKLYHRCYKRLKRFIDRLRRKNLVEVARRLMGSYGSSPRLT